MESDSDKEEILINKVGKKKDRINRYTICERDTLLKLVKKYSHIVLAKRSVCSIDKKNRTWIQLTQEYNEHPDVRKVTTHQLKRHLSNLKYTKIWPNPDNVMIKLDTDFEDTNLEADTKTDITFESIIDEATNYQTHEDNASSYNFQSYEGMTQQNVQQSYEELLAPIISSRMKQIEEATLQRREMHHIAMQREKLQLKLLEEQLKQQSELHYIQSNKEKELQDLRMNQEKNLYEQRVSNEQELHQMKLNEYNRTTTTGSYHIYK